MLNIETTQSKNEVVIAGILNELEVEKKVSKKGADFVSAKATIGVEQEINGKMVVNKIPVKAMAMRLKSNGEENKVYKDICEWGNKFTSLAVCPEDQPERASKVLITSGKIEENVWIDANSGEPKSTWQISTNFLNVPRAGENFVQKALFELTGVVLDKYPEIKNDEETGRIKIRFGVIGYKGKINVIELIAETDNAINFIEANWNEKDTVRVTGAVNVNVSTETWKEEQAFGEPMIRTKLVSRKELIITGGSPCLEEDLCYDAESIEKAILQRNADAMEKKNAAKTETRAQAPKNFGALGF